ncbi:TetR family transcriptional regulator [Humidisolicoccus flavus]|uniref:TetR/AcrR family transcriptional regulator n=1 Tax=Humidisolicoccus flavus TaxID=3111414 RepID=UPI0032541F9B
MESTSSEGRRAAHVRETSRRVRDVALDLFESQGFSETTIDQISDRAAIGRRTFFRYFACKEAVLFSTAQFDALLFEYTLMLESNDSILDALLIATNRAAYDDDAEADDELAARRRRVRHSVLDVPSVAEYYEQFLGRTERALAEVTRAHLPADERSGPIPYLVAGYWRAMCLHHLGSGQTHRFRPDPEPWSRSMRSLLDASNGTL